MRFWDQLSKLALVQLAASAAIGETQRSLLDRAADSTATVVSNADAIAQANNAAYWQNLAKAQGKAICIVKPDQNGGDDGPAISKALNKDCVSNSIVVFPGPVYNIKTPLTTTSMKGVEIHHLGRFLWSTDIDYWVTVSMPIGFQNQSTVWYFGGDNIKLYGHGLGTLDGNGQVWYDWAKSQGNVAHRPMMINWKDMTNSVVQGMRFVQSQMWTMATTYCKNIQFNDIYVNNVSKSKWSTLNTDGIDTINSDNITFRRWDVTQGDDCIALKGNSTNISVYDSVFHGGQGFAIGSVGQYDGWTDTVTNFYAKNVTMHNTAHAIYLKSWGGVSRGLPPNGGGGGLGTASNITLEDITLDHTRQSPFFIWQCENYEGHLGQDCQTSKYKFKDVTASNIKGWTNADVSEVAHIQCSRAAGGCDNITLTGFDIKKGENGPASSRYFCENVHGTAGFTCAPSGKAPVDGNKRISNNDNKSGAATLAPAGALIGAVASVLFALL